MTRLHEKQYNFSGVKTPVALAPAVERKQEQTCFSRLTIRAKTTPTAKTTNDILYNTRFISTNNSYIVGIMIIQQVF